MNWCWRAFSELSNGQVYDILAVRQQVFVVEQKCLYLDVEWARSSGATSVW